MYNNGYPLPPCRYSWYNREKGVNSCGVLFVAASHLLHLTGYSSLSFMPHNNLLNVSLGLILGSITYWLCDFGHISSPP